MYNIHQQRIQSFYQTSSGPASKAKRSAEQCEVWRQELRKLKLVRLEVEKQDPRHEALEDLDIGEISARVL